jgi:four helix bundle protein
VNRSVPKYQNFEELPAWQEAARLYNGVLDLIEEPHAVFSSAFRNQLERAALSVSNNIAEGFERMTTAELLAFLAIARGSAGEVRSMLLVVKRRPKVKRLAGRLEEIAEIAKSCQRQMTAWIGPIENGPVQGKRHLTAAQQKARKAVETARDFRVNWLRELKPDHPLYDSRERRRREANRWKNNQSPIANNQGLPVGPEWASRIRLPPHHRPIGYRPIGYRPNPPVNFRTFAAIRLNSRWQGSATRRPGFATLNGSLQNGSDLPASRPPKIISQPLRNYRGRTL